MEQELTLLLKNGTCLINNTNGQLRQVKADIGILNNKIAVIDENIDENRALNVIDCRHLHVLPGVIDSQVHFREPGLTHKEDLETGTQAALLGGVTSIFEMPNTNPSTTTLDLLNDKLKRAENRCYVNYAFFAGASSENAHLLHQLEVSPGCPGVKVFMGSSTGSLLVDDEQLLELIFKNTKKRIIVHSEDEARLKERRFIAEQGGDSHLHPEWRDVNSALISTKKLLHFAEKYNHLVHVLHITTAEEIDFLETKKKYATIEVLPQHLTLYAPDCYDKLGNFAQQNPPIREKRHYDRLWKAINDGVVDVIGSDHAPHTIEEKNKKYPHSPSGMPGVQTLVPIMLNHVNNGKLTLERFVDLVTKGPRKVFGCLNKGELKVGFDADITIVDLNKQRLIENKWIASRCQWTPYDGMKVKGWATHTIIQGSLSMAEDQIIGPPQGKRVNFE